MITINPFVVAKKQGTEYFLILEDKVFHLQGIAKDIWDYVSENENCSVEDINSFILSEYDVNEKKVSKDISKLIKQLEKEDIISLG
ncbi:PqqD family protein [Listeria monocytogenes]|nr:PqqD family protein [Listeria monocytogenes]MBC1253623.1 PqqD family protein [Listeria welshimeri]